MQKQTTNIFEIRRQHLKEGVTVSQNVVMSELVAIVNTIFKERYLGILAYDTRNGVLNPLNKDAKNVCLSFCSYNTSIYFDINTQRFTESETEITLLMFLDGKARYNFCKEKGVEYFEDYAKVSPKSDLAFQNYSIFQLLIQNDNDYEIFNFSHK